MWIEASLIFFVVLVASVVASYMFSEWFNRFHITTVSIVSIGLSISLVMLLIFETNNLAIIFLIILQTLSFGVMIATGIAKSKKYLTLHFSIVAQLLISFFRNHYVRFVLYFAIVLLVFGFQEFTPPILPGMKASYHGWLTIIGVIMYWDLVLILGFDILKNKTANKSLTHKIKILSQLLIPLTASIILARAFAVSFF
ncbi:hypothetical protein PO360_21790 [Enterobacter ludwigii]|uniref:hypothetical protein n=1 Tax=Enterobacter cloacae complex TaxID=354276 RepID=UPI002FF6C9C3